MMLSRDAGPELGMVSSPYEFERAHPVSYIGGCVRFIFPLGTTALFFLRQDDLQALTKLRVPHYYEEYDGDHTNKVRERIEQNVLPFFARNLVAPANPTNPQIQP